METVSPQYSLIKKIKDDKFDVDHLEQYRLALHIGIKEFQLSIFDANDKCLMLEDYNLNDVQNAEETINILSEIFESHHLLRAGFWNDLKVSFKNKKFTLVPFHLFDEAHTAEYLQLTCELDPEIDEVHHFKHSSGRYVSVFAADRKILNWLRSMYPAISIKALHQSSVIIEGVQQYDEHPAADGMFVYLNRHDLHIVVTSRKQLLYCNAFKCHSPEEFIKFILLVFQELKLNQYQTRVLIWGNLDAESPYFKNLYKYIKHISFAHKPSFLRLDFQFDELQDHEYLDLYSINLC